VSNRIFCVNVGSSLRILKVHFESPGNTGSESGVTFAGVLGNIVKPPFGNTF